MLAISEIVITCFSTVGSEALYFKKPIIILDHLKADLLGLIGKNLALRATNAEEVSVAIDEIINGKETALSNTIETYVYEYALKIDGLASQRILNAIIN
jgi:CDP-glycerol glycerophosphotransferase (TagB/SpsB family)